MQPAERTLAHQLAQREKSRVILQQVPDHQTAGRGPRQSSHRRSASADIERERLLDEHVLAGFQRCARELIVQDRRRGDRNRTYVFVAQQLVPADHSRPVFTRQPARTRLVGVANGGQGTQLSKVANYVLAPIAAADHCNARPRRRAHRGRGIALGPDEVAQIGPIVFLEVDFGHATALRVKTTRKARTKENQTAWQPLAVESLACAVQSRMPP